MALLTRENTEETQQARRRKSYLYRTRSISKQASPSVGVPNRSLCLPSPSHVEESFVLLGQSLFTNPHTLHKQIHFKPTSADIVLWDTDVSLRCLSRKPTAQHWFPRTSPEATVILQNISSFIHQQQLHTRLRSSAPKAIRGLSTVDSYSNTSRNYYDAGFFFYILLKFKVLQ